MKSKLAALLFLAGCSLCGCSADPPPPPAPAPAPPPAPTQVSLDIDASSDVNPDPRGRPSPVMLRVYQLRTAAGFNAADFFAIFQNEKAALAEDLIHREELIMRPGETRSLNFEPKPETQWIAAFAAFRNLDSARWRASASISPHRTNPIAVRLSGNRMELVASPPVADKPAK